MITHLAGLSNRRLVLSFAPKTPYYSVLKRIGELFPGPSKVGGGRGWGGCSWGWAGKAGRGGAGARAAAAARARVWCARGALAAVPGGWLPGQEPCCAQPWQLQR